MRLPHYGSSYNTLHLQFITINSNYRLLNFKQVRRLGGLFFLGTRVISPLLCVIDKGMCNNYLEGGVLRLIGGA